MKVKNARGSVASRQTDWNFDFSSLPRWSNRETVPFIYDSFYHVLGSDSLCCIYSVNEVRMGWYQGFLAILKNKNDPRLILNIAEKITFGDYFSVDKSGNIFFLMGLVSDKKTGGIKCPVIIVDIKNNRISYHDSNNYNPCYRVVELEDSVFGFEVDSSQAETDHRLAALSDQTIDLRLLDWYDFCELNDLVEKI